MMETYDTELGNVGVYETKQEAVESEGTDVRAWMSAIKLSRKSEKDWRKEVNETFDIFSGKKQKKNPINILYANTQTICPAIYNSMPAPDIRARNNNNDQLAKDAALVLERAIEYSSDNYGLHDALRGVVFDAVLRGRGVPRVRYVPVLGSTTDPFTLEQTPIIVDQQTTCELVKWDDFAFGAATRWEDVPWVAYRHLMSRDQLVQMNPEVGELVPMNESVNGCTEEEAKTAPSLFKRAEVWEVWDKESKEIIFVTEGYDKDAILRTKPQFNLQGFFPTPEPLYMIKRTGTLEPLVPYSMYREQAEELNEITKRIKSLVKCLRWRGVYVKGFEAFAEMQDCDDGEFKPTENDFQVLSGMGLDKAVMIMPIGELMQVIEKLSVEREIVKQSIYEITGISDILRGSTKATETLGAQQLKAQWGSVRISDIQQDVQRVARDLIRMMAEIIAEVYTPELLSGISSFDVNTEIMSVLRDDVARNYKIDIETDSTIRADLSRAQQNISQFVTGFGSFIGAVSPAVQAGAMSLEVVADLLSAFARNFKLGRQAEDALERMRQEIIQKQQAQEQIQQQQLLQQQMLPQQQGF